MKRAFSILTLVAAATIALRAASADAKGMPAGNRAVPSKVNNAIIAKGATATKMSNLKNSGALTGLGHGPVVPPSRQTPPITFGGNPPRQTPPITFGGNPPRQTPPITFGGNPPRAPSRGCDHDGCYSHNHRYCNDMMWRGEICLGGLLCNFYGDCDNDSADYDFDFCQ